MSTTTRCDKCRNELPPGYFQVKVNKVHDLCEVCKADLATWLGAAPEPVAPPSSAPEPEPKKKRARG
jgi:hypothetical protein